MGSSIILSVFIKTPPNISDKSNVTNLAAAGTSNREKLLIKAMQSLNQLPPFSPVFSKLLSSLSNENVSVAELANWVEMDAIIAGQVLRTVNSAAYGRTCIVNNLRHAVSVLGLVKLRNLALGLSVTRIWTQVRTPRSWSMARFNLHSAAVAIMADQIAIYTAIEFGEGAFAAGLLHDIGRLVIALGLPEEYEALQQAHGESGRPYVESEREVLGFSHAELGSLILQKWNLPPQIVQAVANLHSLTGDGAVVGSLLWALEAADETVNRMGISVQLQQSPAEDGLASLEGYGFSANGDAILQSFNVEFEVLKTLF